MSRARGRLLAPRPVCAPVGSLAAWPAQTYRCRCGEIVRHVRTAPTVNDWSYETLTGERSRRENSVAGLRNVPQDRLLSEWLDELRAACETDPRATGVYSQLRASLQLGQYSTFHTHDATGDPIEPRPDRDPPFCCASPMRWSPDGWVCRVTGLRFYPR